MGIQHKQDRIENIAYRHKRALDVARSVADGEIDEAAMREYVSYYFGHVHHRAALWDIREEAAQEWANWGGLQILANIQMIRLEREKPFALRLRAMFEEGFTGFTNNDDAIARNVEALTLECKDAIGTLHEEGFERPDLQSELDDALKHDFTGLMGSIRSEQAFLSFTLNRGNRQFDAFAEAADAMVRENEAELGVTMWIHTRRLQNARGNKIAITRLEDEFREMGTNCIEDLGFAPQFIDGARTSVGSLPVLEQRIRQIAAAAGRPFHLQ